MTYYTSTSTFPEHAGNERKKPFAEGSASRRRLENAARGKLSSRFVAKWSGLLMLLVFVFGSQAASAQCITDYDPSSLIKTDCVGEFTFLKVDFTPQPTNPTITWEYSSNGGGAWNPVSASPISHSINNDFALASTRLNLLSPTVMMDNYLFRVVFSGSCVETSNVFTLQLNGPIVISNHPSSLTICEGTNSAGFSAAASDGGAGGTVEYRWQFYNGSSWSFMPNTVSGWNGPNLNLTDAAAFWPAAGTSLLVRCRIRIATCAVVYTNSAALTVNTAPTVDISPESATVCRDDILNLSATVNGVVSSVTWSGDGGGIDDNNALTTFFDPSNSYMMGGSPFFITLTTNDPHGPCSAVTDVIEVTIDDLDIDDHVPGNPTNAGQRTICDMDNTFFRLDYSSTEPVSVINWEFSSGGSPWAPIILLPQGSVDNTTPGETRLNLNTVPHTLDGTLFRVTLISGTCTETSDVFTLNVNGEAIFTMHPENVENLCASTTDTTFAVTATTGSGTINYRWQYNNGGGWTNVPNTVAGFNTPTLNPTNADFPVWPNPGSSVDLRCRIGQENCPNKFSEPATFSVSSDLPAVADAGVDAHICEGDNYFLSGASVSGPGISTGSWHNNGGDGVFNDPNIVTPTYFPGPGDIAAGMVTLTLTTNDPVGVCPPTSDDILITIHPATVVDAGPDQSKCSDELPEFQLAGSVTGTVMGGTWTSSSGLGTFMPSNTALDAIFIPDPMDYGTTVTLTLTSDTPPAFTTCPVVMDMVDITIDDLEILSYQPASLTRVECEGDNSNFRVNYSSSPVSPATVTWQVDGGAGFMDIVFPSGLYDVTSPGGNTQLNLTNVPMGIDGFTYRAILNGGTCSDTSDVFTIQVNESASASAGPDQSICGGENVMLTGNIDGAATSATWSSTGAGIFVPSANDLNATYIPDPADFGSVVTLTLTTDDPAGPCPAGVDDLDVTIDAVAVDSETPATLIRDICEGNNTNFTVQYISMSPFAVPTATWEYSTNGGTSWNDASGLGTITSPALTGMATHSSRLTLTAVPLSYDNYLFRLVVNLGSCDIPVSMFALYVQPGPTVDAGTDFSVCAGSDIVLDGTIGGSANTGTWTTSGMGAFSGVDLFAGDATYTPLPSEYGTVLSFTLMTDNPGGSCPAVSETIMVTIDELIITSYSPVSQMTEVCHGVMDEIFEVNYTSSPGAQAPTWEFSSDGGTIWMPAAGPDFVVENPSAILTRLRIPTVTSDMDGYLFRAVFADGACTPAVSDEFTLQVNGPITINAQPVDILDECQATELVTFEATVDNPGSGTLIYLWQKSANGINGWSAVAETPGVTEGTTTGTLTVYNAGFPAGPFPANVFYRLRIQLAECTPPNVFSDVVEFSVSADMPAIADAGGPYDYCMATPLLPYTPLAGMPLGTATSGSWSTLGDGTFADPNFPGTTYMPGPGDIAAAEAGGAMGTTIKLVFTTNDPAGNVCVSATDTADFVLYPETVVDAGPDQNQCEAMGMTFQLAGSVTGTVTTGSWSTPGDGMFDDINALDAVYTPGAMDIANGSVTLTLTNTGMVAMPCPAPISDMVTLTIDKLTIDSYSNGALPICEDGGSTFFRVNYTASAASSVNWQVDLGGGFEDVATAMVLVDGSPTPIDYTLLTPGGNTRININSAPFELDGADFRVVITAGDCELIGDPFTIDVNEEATVNAGPDQTICAGDVVNLAGMVGGGATVGTWSGGTMAAFSDVNDLNATYTPTPAEIAAGMVTLTLSTNDPSGPCPAATPDMMTIFIDELHIDSNVPATFVRNVCQGQNTTFRSDYTAIESGMPAAASVVWQYSPDGGANWFDADITNGGIGTVSSPAPGGMSTAATRLIIMDVPLTYDDYLVRVTVGAGVCTPVQSMFALEVNPGPTVDAGPDQTICFGDVAILDGTLGGSATTGTWTRIGTNPPSMATPGTISGDNPFAADAIYTPHPDEYGTSVLLKLTTDNPGGACPAVMDTIELTIDFLDIISYNPVSLARTECVGDAEFFEVNYVSAPGTQSPTWEVSSDGMTWSPVTGPEYSVDNSSLTQTRLDIPSVTNAMNGLMYRAVLTSGTCAPIYSDAFTLQVNGPITITQQPVDIQNVCGGTETVQFIADATNGGEGTMTFLWQYSADGISGWLPLTEIMGESEGVGTGTLTLYDNWSQWPMLGGNVFLRMRTSLNSCSVETTNVVEFSIHPDLPAALDVSGSVDEICEGSTALMNADLSGGSATSVSWTTNGDGTFDNPNTQNPTYTPGPNDLANAQLSGPAGFVVELTCTTNNPFNNICPAISDVVELTIYPAIMVDAGVDVNVCIDGTEHDPILLNGLVTGAVTDGTWNPGGGLLDPTDASTIYTPTNAHVNSGERRLILTSDPHPVCPTVRDTVFVFFNDDFGPLTYNPGGVTAGTNIVCNGDDTSFRVIHGMTPVTNVQWQYNNGSGWTNVNDVTNPLTGVSIFNVSSPSPGGNFATQLNLEGVTPAVHNFDFRVLLENGECTTTSEAFNLQVNGDIGTITMPADVVVCESVTSQTFNATVGASGNGTLEYRWQYSNNSPLGPFLNVPSLGATGESTMDLTLTAASSAYPTVGTTVYLRLRVTLEGCTTVFSDPVEFGVESAANVYAGVDQTICEGEIALMASAFFSGAATSVTWTSGGDGTFDDATEILAIYTPGPMDIANGSVVLTVTTNDPQGDECDPVFDDMTLSIDPAATVDAGPDQVVCVDQLVDVFNNPLPGGFLQLAGSFGGSATMATWSSSGDGSFDDINDVNATYTPGPMDRSSGEVTLTLLTDDPGTACLAVSDQMVITIGPGVVITSYVPTSRERTICHGGSATFRVNTDPTVLGTHDWQYSFNGTDWFDDFNSLGFASYIESGFDSYTELTLGGGDPMLPNGVLFARVTIEDRDCDETSEVFTLNINGPFDWDMQPSDVVICQDITLASFTAMTFNEGAGTVSYQWQYDNGGGFVDVPGTVAGFNGTTLFLTNTASFWPVPGNTVDIRLEATLDECGTIYSEIVTLEREVCADPVDLFATISFENTIFNAFPEQQNYILNVVNLSPGASTTPIQVVLLNTPGYDLTFDPMVTNIDVSGSMAVNNGDWTATTIPAGTLFQSNVPIAAGGFSRIGITLTSNTGGTNTQLNFQLIPGTGNDNNNGNNQDIILISTVSN